MDKSNGFVFPFKIACFYRYIVGLKSAGKTWCFKTPAKICSTFLVKSAGEAGRVFPALEVLKPPSSTFFVGALVVQWNPDLVNFLVALKMLIKSGF